MVTSRSGIILALLLIPAVLLSSSRTVSIKSISKAICLFACFFATFSGLYFFLSYILPPNKYVGYTSKHLEEIFLFFLNGGQTRTTELLADMLFLPSNWKETLFGNSLTGREPSAYVDRKSVVEGQSVSVRLDLGGRRIIKKKKNEKK